MSSIKNYLHEVAAEVKKVVWPSRAELKGVSIIVCLLALFFAALLGSMDSVFSILVRKIIS